MQILCFFASFLLIDPTFFNCPPIYILESNHSHLSIGSLRKLILVPIDLQEPPRYMPFSSSSFNFKKVNLFLIINNFDIVLYFHDTGSGEMEENTLINRDQQIIFTRETLLTATNYFHDDNKLGEGGFDIVYKVT